MTADMIKLTNYLDKFWNAINDINQIMIVESEDEEESEK